MDKPPLPETPDPPAPPAAALDISAILKVFADATAIHDSKTALDRLLDIEQKAWLMAVDLHQKMGRLSPRSDHGNIEQLIALAERISRHLRRRIGLADDPPSPSRDPTVS